MLHYVLGDWKRKRCRCDWNVVPALGCFWGWGWGSGGHRHGKSPVVQWCDAVQTQARKWLILLRTG